MGVDYAKSWRGMSKKRAFRAVYDQCGRLAVGLMPEGWLFPTCEALCF